MNDCAAVYISLVWLKMKMEFLGIALVQHGHYLSKRVQNISYSCINAWRFCGCMDSHYCIQ